MIDELPPWTLRKPAVDEFFSVRRAQRRGRVLVVWPESKALRTWAKEQSWPAPRSGFEKAFLAKMFENEANYTLALGESGVELFVPIKRYTITQEKLAELDGLYEARSWAVLVAELREIRRLAEVGVKVEIVNTDTVFASWQGFYDWAHGRYHMLEDGYDSWIGDDSS